MTYDVKEAHRDGRHVGDLWFRTICPDCRKATP